MSERLSGSKCVHTGAPCLQPGEGQDRAFALKFGDEQVERRGVVLSGRSLPTLSWWAEERWQQGLAKPKSLERAPGCQPLWGGTREHLRDAVAWHGDYSWDIAGAEEPNLPQGALAVLSPRKWPWPGSWHLSDNSHEAHFSLCGSHNPCTA